MFREEIEFFNFFFSKIQPLLPKKNKFCTSKRFKFSNILPLWQPWESEKPVFAKNGRSCKICLIYEHSDVCWMVIMAPRRRSVFREFLEKKMENQSFQIPLIILISFAQSLSLSLITYHIPNEIFYIFSLQNRKFYSSGGSGSTYLIADLLTDKTYVLPEDTAKTLIRSDITISYHLPITESFIFPSSEWSKWYQ